MSTPLKALLQERLRAKIVRQEDEDDVVAADSAAPALIDPSESMVPSPHAALRESRQRGCTITTAPSNHRRSRTPIDPLTFGDELRQSIHTNERSYAYHSTRDEFEDNERDSEAADHRRQYDTSRRLVGRGEAQALRDESPHRAYCGSKRQWREPREERTTGRDDEPSYRHKRLARERRTVERQQHHQQSLTLPVMPRKNYDLSSAYQQYRELSSKRGYTSRAPGFYDRHEYDDMSAAWSSSEFTRSVRPLAFDDEYHPPARRDEAYTKPIEHRAARWLSPTRSSTLRSSAPGDSALKVDILSAYETKTDTTEAAASHHYADRECYPVEHISPTYRAAVISPRASSVERRTATSGFSSRFYEPYNTSHLHNASENRIVFHSVARVVPAPRSPCNRQFLRHETTMDDTSASTFLDRAQCFDSKLSPESHQAAKEFVEKRQKRSSQGTPRTMATHRWLQSMVDARRDLQDDTPTATRADSPFEPSESGDHGSYAHNDDRALLKPTASHYHYHDASHSIRDVALSPVYSPPRYASAASTFFSSAV